MYNTGNISSNSDSGTSTPSSASSSLSNNLEYFGTTIFESPLHSAPNSDSEFEETTDGGESSSGASESTLEDDEVRKEFGHPLERIPRGRSVNIDEAVSGTENDSNHSCSYEGRDPASTCSSCCTSRSQSSVSMASSVSYGHIDYEEFVENLLTLPSNPFKGSYNGELVMYTPESSSTQPLMLKRLPRSSPELFLLLELNQPDLRQDPWNPAPHILCTVEGENDIYLCMERLRAYDRPPIARVTHWVDFYRQILEGLAFLHERSIACLSLLHPSTYMVDLSSAPLATPTSPHPLSRRPTLGVTFDRESYPVRYYISDYSRAVRSSDEVPSPGPEAKQDGHLSRLPDLSDPFKRDVFECGLFIEQTSTKVPPIATKLKALITAMTVGRFAADDARRLFEALCRSLPGDVFDLPASQVETWAAKPSKAEGAARGEGGDDAAGPEDTSSVATEAQEPLAEVKMVSTQAEVLEVGRES